MIIALYILTSIFVVLGTANEGFTTFCKSVKGTLIGFGILIAGIFSGMYATHYIYTNNISVVRIDNQTGKAMYQIRMGDFTKMVETRIQVMTAEEAGLK